MVPSLLQVLSNLVFLLTVHIQDVSKASIEQHCHQEERQLLKAELEMTEITVSIATLSVIRAKR